MENSKADISEKLIHLSSTFMMIYSPMEAKTFSEKANIIMLTMVELNENSISENDVTFDDVELMFTQTVTTLKEVSATATGMSKVISRLKPCLIDEISKQKYIEDLKRKLWINTFLSSL
jgi:Cdc6-like AAA superfamily ATPase